MVVEELVILVVQGVFEFLFNLFIWFPWDIFVWWRERKTPLDQRPSDRWVVPVGGLIFGAIFGGTSLLVLPTTLLRHEYARLANLLATPLLCALFARWLAQRRVKRGQVSSASLHFWFAFTLLYRASRCSVRVGEPAGVSASVGRPRSRRYARPRPSC